MTDAARLAEIATIAAARDLVDYVDTEGSANIDTAIDTLARSVDDWRRATGRVDYTL